MANKWQVLVADPARQTRMGLGVFENELDAAAAYDCGVLLLHGVGAKTNFDSDRYRPHDFEAMQALIDQRRARQFSSQYNGVVRQASNGKFLARVALHDGTGMQAHIGSFDDTVLAAQAHDSALRNIVGLPRSTLLRFLNFKHDSDYFNLDTWEQEPVFARKTSLFIGVYKCKPDKFRSIVGLRQVAYCDSELEAAQRFDTASMLIGGPTNFLPQLYKQAPASHGNEITRDEQAFLSCHNMIPNSEGYNANRPRHTTPSLSACLTLAACATRQRSKEEKRSLLDKFAQAAAKGDAQELSALRSPLEKQLQSRARPSASDWQFQPDQELVLLPWPGRGQGWLSQDSDKVDNSGSPSETNHVQLVIARDLPSKLIAPILATVLTQQIGAPAAASKPPPAQLLRDLSQVMQVIGGPHCKLKVGKCWPLAFFEGGKEAASRSDRNI
ncbi:unnamed protein product [Polarella glacialis]|uniref:AP2/ERF domain-containing protein n=1 Tax=Polarella glacialis TaxID=89957 RepID=A0A813LIT8_POLGL|nr:unnamed protein product [Polarella glacialis]